MLLLMTVVAILVIAFFSYAIFLRRRDAAARRAWEAYCNEQALANDAARAARRAKATAALDMPPSAGQHAAPAAVSPADVSDA